MATQGQYAEASAFMRSYQDALRCVEQIAERRQGAAHYERSAAALTKGLQKNQIKIADGQVAPSDNAAKFSLARAHKHVQSLWGEHEFATASNAADLNSKLDAAIASYEKDVKLIWNRERETTQNKPEKGKVKTL